MPRITRPQVYRVVREMLPRKRFGPDELLRWLEDVQERGERARLSRQKRRSTCRAPAGIPPSRRRCNTRTRISDPSVFMEPTTAGLPLAVAMRNPKVLPYLMPSMTLRAAAHAPMFTTRNMMTLSPERSACAKEKGNSAVS